MNSDWKEQMCANIKTRRKALGLSQAQAGERAGTNQGGWGHWETGRRVPTIDNLYAIAQALGCTTHTLLPPKGNSMSYPDFIRRTFEDAAEEVRRRLPSVTISQREDGAQIFTLEQSQCKDPDENKATLIYEEKAEERKAQVSLCVGHGSGKKHLSSVKKVNFLDSSTAQNVEAYGPPSIVIAEEVVEQLKGLIQ